jgi:PAS domain S-box-containing protein
MRLLDRLSLRGRFLFVPLVCIAVVTILFASNNATMKENKQVLQQLGNDNLPQFGEISNLSIRMNNSHTRLTLLLLSAINDPDEERIYLEGRDLVFHLHDIEKQLKGIVSSIGNEDKAIIEDISKTFRIYVYAANSGIEIVTVDTDLALQELNNASQSLEHLNELFLALSDYHSEKLDTTATLTTALIEKSTIRNIIAGVILALTLLLAFYISHDLSSKLDGIIQALISLSKKKKIPKLSSHSDTHLQQLTDAVLTFEQTLNANEQHRKQLQAAILELDQQKFALDEHSIVGITDIRGNITYCNDKFCDISGYSREELLGQNHRILNSGFHDKSIFTDMYKTISKGKAWHGEFCNRNKNGALYWVDSTIVPFLNEQGKPVNYIAIRTDITQTKENELSLIKAKEEADAAVIAKSEFLATMSHEIRTPMNGVLGMLELLLNMSLNKEQKHRAELAKTSAKSLLNLINDILDFSRVDAGKMEVEHLDFNVRQLFDDFAESMALSAQEKHIELTIDTTGIDNPMVTGDPSRISQILTNLTGNAIKFTDEGEILIEARLEENANSEVILHCQVKDSGIGIPADRLDHLFERFTQVDSSTTRKYGGTGLGLAIVKKLCHLMNGDVSAQSVDGQGSTFSFHVSLSRPDLHAPQIAPNQLQSHSALIIDPSPAHGLVLQKMLSLWGASVTVVKSQSDALNLFDNNQLPETHNGFDIILIDFHMLTNQATHFTRDLRDKNKNKNPQVIAMTPMAHTGDWGYFSAHGFDDFFSKPATRSDLKKSLNLELENSHSSNTQSQQEPANPIDTQALKNVDITGTRLLLVEDNPINQQVAQFMLEDMGIEPDIAANGEECLAAMNQASEPYQIVLMDCQMPVMNGYQATEAIRAGDAGESNCHIPVIALTANAVSGDREKCLNAGMNDYLSKPIEEDKLASVIASYTR